MNYGTECHTLLVLTTCHPDTLISRIQLFICLHYFYLFIFFFYFFLFIFFFGGGGVGGVGGWDKI